MDELNGKGCGLTMTLMACKVDPDTNTDGTDETLSIW